VSCICFLVGLCSPLQMGFVGSSKGFVFGGHWNGPPFCLFSFQLSHSVSSELLS